MPSQTLFVLFGKPCIGTKTSDSNDAVLLRSIYLGSGPSETGITPALDVPRSIVSATSSNNSLVGVSSLKKSSSAVGFANSFGGFSRSDISDTVTPSTMSSPDLLDDFRYFYHLQAKSQSIRSWCDVDVQIPVEEEQMRMMNVDQSDSVLLPSNDSSPSNL